MKNYSNYYDINTSEKITHDGLFLLERSLEGYAGYEVLINDDYTSKVLMYQKWDSNGEGKKVIGRIEDIERGNLINHDDEYWLVITKPEDNRIYRKAEVRLCSSDFPIEQIFEEIEVGTDMLGNPVFESTLIETKYSPCVVEMNTASVAIADDNKGINLLDNKIFITIPFIRSDNIKIDKTFIMYDLTYRIIRVDETKSINSIGIVSITGELTGGAE
ncbi:hypothetical protein [Psychrobacillus phage Perkons]|nr:hypothetical protein [Psychrobacillus phage Perkons]